MLYNTWLAKIFVSVHQPSSLWTSALISGGNNLLVYKCIIIFFICETLKVQSTRKQHEKAQEGKGIFSEYCIVQHQLHVSSLHPGDDVILLPL